MLRGTPLHEIVNLGPYWMKIYGTQYDPIESVKYEFGPDPKQYYIHSFPKERKAPSKGVLYYYHGGGWRFGSPELFECHAAYFIDKGWDVVMPSYRRIPKFNNDDIYEDVVNGFVDSLDRLTDTGCNTANVVIGGMSAGAHLSSLLYLRKKEISDDLEQTIKGLILLGAPVNLAMMRWSFTLYSLAGKRKSRLFQRSNPINYVTKERLTAPILCIHGTQDGLVEYASTYSFVKKVKELNSGLIEFHTLKNKTHLDCAKWSFQKDEVGELLERFLNKLD